jgi:glutathione-regulated potassium-efflux system protein KefB
VRRRDETRFELEMAGGTDAASALLRGNLWKPTPLVEPRRPGKPVSAEQQGLGDERDIE